MFEFYGKKILNFFKNIINKPVEKIDLEERIRQSEFELPEDKTLTKKTLVDLLEPKTKTDAEITDELLDSLSTFRKNTPEFDHYREEIAQIMDSEEGKEQFYKHLGNSINKK